MDSDQRQALLGYQETQHLSFTPLNRLIFRKIVGLGRIGLQKQTAPVHLALLPVSAIALSPVIATFMTGIEHILWPSPEPAVYRDVWCWHCVFCQVLCVCVCQCVHGCMFVFTCPCVYMWICVMWTSQVKGRCLPPSLAWHLLFETKSLLEPGAWALGPRVLLVFFSHPARAVLTATHHHVWLLHGGWDHTLALMLVWQAVYLLSRLPSPVLWVLTNKWCPPSQF